MIRDTSSTIIIFAKERKTVEKHLDNIAFSPETIRSEAVRLRGQGSITQKELETIQSIENDTLTETFKKIAYDSDAFMDAFSNVKWETIQHFQSS